MNRLTEAKNVNKRDTKKLNPLRWELTKCEFLLLPNGDKQVKQRKKHKKALRKAR